LREIFGECLEVLLDMWHAQSRCIHTTRRAGRTYGTARQTDGETETRERERERERERGAE